MDSKDYRLTSLNLQDREKVLSLLGEVFEKEQAIPSAYLPVPYPVQKGYGLWLGLQLIGVVIIWYDGLTWHWGRFAVHPQLRGLGWGKKLAYFSLESFFQEVSEELMIEARDVTVNLLVGLGARIVGEPYDIFGKVTPMKLSPNDFKKITPISGC
ncbi:GNAT family N-acetyltransferase [Mongoliitalea daihaiensis]|uniref:GNAT family N-acetyltransferase n=1 Tax=Mongoliitalea daihaiensis TaxID=2782006 RepID=UPI001F21FCCF|nr:GNAT family N-acetyltransferase [Mongoliitalea daihaiensis]UJP64077.1 MarR family transcriptional regulator [Mongoliitalea daihaiensis]